MIPSIEMNSLNPIDAFDAIFHLVDEKRIAMIKQIDLRDILLNENPYQLIAESRCLTVTGIIKNLVDKYTLTFEQVILEDLLIQLAISACQTNRNGNKSMLRGIDLEFDKDGIRYIVAIKSGPNWGNSSQIQKMKDNFKTATRALRTSNSRLQIIAVNGCCYGRDNNPDKGEYFKYCGQQFWEFISGNPELYTEIIEPLGHRAKEKNDEFMQFYEQMINKFTREFAIDFCSESGKIDWNKLVQFNSGNVTNS